MTNNYKIYYDDSFVLITDDREQMNKNFTKVIAGDNDIADFLRHPVFFDEPPLAHQSILLYSEKPDWVMDFFKKNLKVVVAAGGIVFNEKDEVLMIHRKGKWDLPKGKLDPGEKLLKAAEREVEEETGVKIESTINDPYVTYHAYVLKDKKCLKETSWYEMTARPGQNKLTPQAEEGIDEVKWVKKSDLKNYEEGSHPLVRELIRAYYPVRL